MSGQPLPTRACKHCGEQVAWVRLDTGNALPVDPDPTPRGNVFVEWKDGHLTARVAGRGKVLPGVAFMPHHATCVVLNKTRPVKPTTPPKPTGPQPEQQTLL